MNKKASQTEFNVREFNNLQLYLLSVATGIALNKENMDVLQAFVDRVVMVAEQQAITEPQVVFAIFLGQPSDEGEKVRTKVMQEMKNSQGPAIIEAIEQIDSTYNEHVNTLLNRHKDIVIELPIAHQDFFDEVTREYFWLYAAMLIPAAVGLRKYHLGMGNVKPEEVVDRYERSLREYYQEYFSMQMEADDTNAEG